ncbi:MAG: hypothetical protein NCW75_09425 [Phycisphaera sp.]|nr:MAG: hypothetical protein NCW75_09425 [Phycisphaera sp.]
MADGTTNQKRHRVVTARMVVASALVGVVLAVASVPVSAAIMYGVLWTTVVSHAQFEDGAASVEAFRTVGFGAEFWFVSANGALALKDLRDVSEVPVAATDPRPGYARPAWGGTPANASYLHVRHGWPWRAAEGRQVYPPGQLSSLVRMTYWNIGPGRHLVPLAPVWPGLVANTLFYATLTLVPLAGLRSWRTRRRRKRGRCVACGYELGEGVGVGVCPECGLAKRPLAKGA